MSGITITADSGTQFEAGAAEFNSICKLDSNTYCIAFRDNSDGNKGKVLVGTRTGTSISVSFANAATVYSNSIDIVNVVAMSSTKIAVAVRDTATKQGYTIICTISGVTVTAGTATSTGASSTFGCSIAALDSSNVVFCIGKQNGGGGDATCYVGSVSGTTPTYGSAQTALSANYTYPFCLALDSTHIAISCHKFTIPNLSSIVGTVNTGAQTISFGSESNGGSFTNDSFIPLMSAFDSSHFITGYRYDGGGGNTDLFLVVYEVNLSTDALTAGTPIRNTTSSSADSNYALCAIGTNNFLISYYTTTGTQCEMRGGTFTGSNTIAFDAQGAVIVDNTISSYTALCALNSTDFIIGLKEG